MTTIGAVIYASIFGMMCMGLTVTYLTTKVPNFAFGSFVTVGIYTAFSLFTVDRIEPYSSIPLAFMLGGLSAVLTYALVLKPLSKRGISIVGLMIATLAVDVVFTGVIQIFADYLYFTFRVITRLQFPAVGHDFQLFGTPGLFFTAPATLALATIAIYLLLTKTRFGVSTRAAVENAALARTLGVNIERVYLVSWFIAGGLAGMAGPFYVLFNGGSSDIGSLLIVGIFAGSVLGGLSSVYGGMIGGLLVGLSTVLITTWFDSIFGTWFLAYENGVPLIIMIATLLIIPQGIVSVIPRSIKRRSRY